MELGVGAHVGDYRLERLLGRGGMGEVYLATDDRLDRSVALKFLSTEFGRDATFRERFLAESRVAASMDHPHIVPIYEAGQHEDRLFIAMRYVDGTDLGTLIQREGPLGISRAMGLLRGVADALDAAHDRGLVHRDVKPGNILVTTTARLGEHAYLADFGLVKHLGSAADFTQAGQIIGSLGYIAPEQIEGRPIDGRADVYSFACVLYEVLTGRPPFVHDHDVATLWSHLQAPRPRVSDIVPALASIDDVLARGMAVDPNDRFTGAGELLRAMGDALEIDSDRPTAIQPGAIRTGPPSRRPSDSGQAADRESIAVDAVVSAAPSTPAWKRLAAKRDGRGAGLVVAAGVVALVGSLAGVVLFAGRSPGPGASGGPSAAANAPTLRPTPSAPAEGPSSPAVVSIAAADIEAAPDHRFQLTPNEYRLAELQPPIQLEIDREGWFIDRVFPDGFNLNYQPDLTADSPGYIAGGVVQVVLTTPCRDGETLVIGRDPAALVNWLGTNEWLTVTAPLPVNLGGRTGLQVDVSQAKSPKGTCDIEPDLPEAVKKRIESSVYIFLYGEDNFWVGGNEKVRVTVIDVDGKPFTILAGTDQAEEFPAFVGAAQPILESLRFAPS